jgi:hypothetical protein
LFSLPVIASLACSGVLSGSAGACRPTGESMPSAPITTARVTIPITTYNSVKKWLGKKGTLSFSVSGCVVAIKTLLR